MPRLRHIGEYLWAGAIVAPVLIVGAGALYYGYNHEKRAAARVAQRRKDEKIERSWRKGCGPGPV